ncbi:metallophosphoesterase [Psychrobium sp. MM17-31]|uniref:metallophosphoesterase n=1 Tax=Psychrobium sp. MM17-31 TaxID=2917758 RepID=UPI001EF5DE6D|nr:metallophosphoesterase [Psychrobium sp. MM17-31]MCG7530748.1 metallophosphoesterase [Psychrobium sp. MM17-31]
MIRAITLLTASLMLSSCSIVTNISLMGEGEDIDIGIKIATIADSQITTEKNSEGNPFRTPLADKFSNWAVRTTTQETLALENLGYFFSDMKNQNPDIVFYLGDGMNSGCKDEADEFFSTLRHSRKELGKPIYFVIGNHDYLATGNQVEPAIRRASCGGEEGSTDKFYYTKKEIIKMTYQFNRESFSSFSDPSIFITFKDNIHPIEAGTTIEESLDDICPGPSQEQHKNGCFYSGIIEYSKGGIQGQIILTDTSDYQDINVKPEVLITEVYGVRGSISWEEGGQTDWINSNLNSSYDDVRIITSHYPIEGLGYTSVYVGRPADLLLKGKNRNLWLSAHTHIEDPDEGPRNNRFAENFYITTVATTAHRNVGSTTDYHPHYSIVESKNRKIEMATFPNFEELQCDSLVSGISLNFNYFPVLGDKTSPEVLIGMTGDYRKEGYSTKNARNNLRKYLDSIEVSERNKHVMCLMYVSAKNERKLRSVQRD